MRRLVERSLLLDLKEGWNHNKIQKDKGGEVPVRATPIDIFKYMPVMEEKNYN